MNVQARCSTLCELNTQDAEAAQSTQQDPPF